MIQVSQNFYVLHKKKGLSEKHASAKVESFLMTFFDLNQCLQKTLLFRTFVQCAHFAFALKVWEILWRDKRGHNIEACNRSGWATKKIFFTQTIVEEIHETISGN